MEVKWLTDAKIGEWLKRYENKVCCVKCKYYEQSEALHEVLNSDGDPVGVDGSGWCHRYPPIKWHYEEGPDFIFPLVEPYEWCGEFSIDPQWRDAIVPHPIAR